MQESAASPFSSAAQLSKSDWVNSSFMGSSTGCLQAATCTSSVLPCDSHQSETGKICSPVTPFHFAPIYPSWKVGQSWTCFHFRFLLEFSCNSTKFNSLSRESSKYITECFCLHVLTDLFIFSMWCMFTKGQCTILLFRLKMPGLIFIFPLEINTGLPLAASRHGIARELPGAMAETTLVTPGWFATSLSQFQMYQCYLLSPSSACAEGG